MNLALISTKRSTIDVGKELQQKYGVDILPMQVDVKDSESVNQGR